MRLEREQVIDLFPNGPDWRAAPTRTSGDWLRPSPMKKLGILVAVVAVAIAAFWLAFPTHAYRYRLTISAEVNGEVRSASSVIEVSMRRQPQFLGMPPYEIRIQGEAIFLDLGRNRNVLGTLRFGQTGNDDRLASIAFDLFDVKKIKDTWTILANSNEQRELRGEYIPTLVTFSNPADPNTARVVVPENFPAVFGSDVRFVGAKVQVTRDPVTEGIEASLPWIPEMRKQLRDRGELRYPDRLNVVPSLFKRG